ncbi:MAG: 16S rRNA (guanine(527)-N(7))-methyltransferase RsmG [Cyanobacteria bacterium P01_F01_bin.42]
MSIDWDQTLGWSPAPVQVEKFEHLYSLLLAANQSVNLTRLTTPEDFLEKHLWDSLAGLQPWLVSHDKTMGTQLSSRAVQSAIDIGTGGGFPGIPAAIAFPNWQVALLDSITKKVQCLGQILEQLKLSNAEALCDRAENLARQANRRGQYDLALIRAVAAAPVCAEYAIPLVREQGVVVLYRGQWEKQETDRLEQALEQLGGELCHIQRFQTPVSGGDRHCIYLKKVAPTPERYPRRAGVPAKKPLG